MPDEATGRSASEDLIIFGVQRWKIDRFMMQLDKSNGEERVAFAPATLWLGLMQCTKVMLPPLYQRRGRRQPSLR